MYQYLLQQIYELRFESLSFTSPNILLVIDIR